MSLLLKLTSFLSMALVVMAAQHNVHLNRNVHHDLAKRAPGHVELHRRFSNAKFSYYDAQTGNKGACGTFIGNSDFTVALNTPQYGGGYPGPNCFKKISISFGGKTATATILDQCPGCPYGGLDLTPGLFAYFASHDRGIIYGEWHFIGDGDDEPAPTTTKTTSKAQPTTTWTPPTTTRKTTTKTTPTTTWTPPTTSSTRTTSSTSSTRTSSSSSTTSSSSSTSSSASSSAARQSSTASANIAPTATAAAGGALSDVNDSIVRLAGLVVQGAAN